MKKKNGVLFVVFGYNSFLRFDIMNFYVSVQKYYS